MANVLNIGASALMAFQRAMATTGNNVANVNTEGYSRQTVNLSTRIPQYTGSGYIGSGVQVVNVRRQYDDFLAAQVRGSHSAVADFETYYSYASQIDQTVADTDMGVDATVQDFFDAMQQLSDDPSSTSVREVLLSESQSMVERFNYFQRQFEDTRTRLHSDMGLVVDEVNRLAEEIVDLNRAITGAPGFHRGILPNDLLDQRDQRIQDLSQFVNVSILEQDDGNVNVYFGKGQALVLGDQASQLSLVHSPETADHMEIGYAFGGGSPSIISQQVTGGKLGGLLTVRDEILDQGQRQLGLLAVALTQDINDQHRLGMGLNGSTGNAFFADLNVTAAIAHADNDPATDVTLDAQVTNVSHLRPDEYRVEFEAGQYTVTRLSDKQVVGGPVAGFPLDLSDTEGFIINQPSGASVADGDSFLLRPTYSAAANFSRVLNDTQDVAAALRVEVGDSVPNVANTGAGLVSDISLRNVVTPPLGAGPITLTLTYAGANTLTYDDGAGSSGSLTYTPASDASGKAMSAVLSNPPAYEFDLRFTLSGAPAVGDTFTVQITDNGALSAVSDNRNALFMDGLQNAKTLLASGRPTATYQDAFANYVALTGSKTRQANINLQAQQGLLEVNRDAMQAISGVNLDEEAANLIRFQQAYQAAAQVISTAKTVFDTLISAVR